MNQEINNVLIITGGQIKDEFLCELLSKERFTTIIAADHGLLAVDKLGISLDYIVGDFDSVPDEILKKYRASSTPTMTYPTEKDKTDTQIAIELALEHNATSITIVGATGSRLDHMIANIHLLLLPLEQKIDACIIDANNKVYLKQDSFRIEKARQHGEYLSLLPFSEEAYGLTLTGFKYPLNNITLTVGSSLGISNEIQADIALVEFNKGTLLVIESRD
jgi:thiamine pyrophosphokinase